MNEPTNKPIAVFRAAGVKASVWLNRSEKTGDPFFSTSIVRSYFDEDSQQWKDTVSFGRDDLPKVRLVTEQAYSFIFLKTQELGAESEPESHAEKVTRKRTTTQAGGKDAA